MKTKLAQLHLFVSGIDRRYIQAAYFLFTLFVAAILNTPDDGTGGVRH